MQRARQRGWRPRTKRPTGRSSGGRGCPNRSVAPPGRGSGGSDDIYYEAAIWVGMALLAGLVSIRIAIPVALVEIVIGAIFCESPRRQGAHYTGHFRNISRRRGLDRAHLLGRGRDRPRVPQTSSESQHQHRCGVLRVAFLCRFRVLLLGVVMGNQQLHKTEHHCKRALVRDVLTGPVRP